MNSSKSSKGVYVFKCHMSGLVDLTDLSFSSKRDSNNLLKQIVMALNIVNEEVLLLIYGSFKTK